LVGRGDDSRRLLVNVPEEVFQGALDPHIHINRGVDLNGIEFDVNTACKKAGATEQEKAAKHTKKGLKRDEVWQRKFLYSSTHLE
jgi:hypothetical protein